MSEELDTSGGEESLPLTAQEQLQRLTDTANRMLDGLNAASPTADTVKLMNSIRQLVLANAEISLKVARTTALQNEKEVNHNLAHDDSVAEVYKWIIRNLESEEGIERMRDSLKRALG